MKDSTSTLLTTIHKMCSVYNICDLLHAMDQISVVLCFSILQFYYLVFDYSVNVFSVIIEFYASAQKCLLLECVIKERNLQHWRLYI